MKIETEIVPPEHDEDDGGGNLPSSRITIHYLAVDDVCHEAAVQLFGQQASDPERFAEALLRTALACAQLCGPDFAWAAAQRFATYDGGSR